MDEKNYSPEELATRLLENDDFHMFIPGLDPKKKLKDKMIEDVAALIDEISEDVESGEYEHGYDNEGDEDEEPAVQVTIATDDLTGWGYQTGDTSYTGGAYGYRHWAVRYIGAGVDGRVEAEDIVEELAGMIEEVEAD